MHNEAPPNYVCPLCLAVRGIENADTMVKQADIVSKDDTAIIFIASKFVGNNPGHPIVIPTRHFENFYELPDETAAHIMILAKKIAIALKEIRKCEGVTILQTNGRAGGQHAFHYHLHVFPRFYDDKFIENIGNTRDSQPEERLPYSEALKSYLT